MIFDSEHTDKTSDARLLELFADTGKNDYFGVLYTRYIPLIYGVCLKYLGDQAAAEDAVMQIFEETMPKIGRFYVREFRTWIYSVARNHCLQRLRTRKREIRLDSAISCMESVDLVHLLSKQDDEIRFAVLEKCLESLPPQQQKSITLFFFEGKSYADIVDSTRFTTKGVKSHIQNGKRNLRKCMEKNGIKLL